MSEGVRKWGGKTGWFCALFATLCCDSTVKSDIKDESQQKQEDSTCLNKYL